ncbi:MAG: HEAT repeat domain-containing protein [Anaerolineae bacterium]|nr:HEAT repeat domain-containing protein [Anaerolineae bacterium]
MHPIDALQARGGWQFDIRSAAIGVAFAWIIAAILYGQRRAIGVAVQKVWTPIAAWRSRARASQEEKYLSALYEQLRHSLLLEPADLSAGFIPPTFAVPAPLPASVADAANAPRTVEIPLAALLSGHPRLIISGTQGSGRTTAMVYLVHQALQNLAPAGKGGRRRLPLWIDLAHTPSASAGKVSSAAEAIVTAAAAYLPAVLPQWLLQRLRREPCLVLLDNWDQLAPDRRAEVALRISEADDEFADTVWMVSAAPEGYSDLTAAGFVPIEVIPQGRSQWRRALYEAWQSSLGRVAEPPDDEALTAIARAADAGAPPWELQIRTMVHLATGDLPSRPVEAVDRYIATKIGAVPLGKAPEEFVDAAQQVALDALMAVSARARLDGQPVLTNKDMRDLLEAQREGRSGQDHRQEEAVRKILTGSGLLRQNGRTWQIAHPILADYLAACHLVREEAGSAIIEAHLEDPQWHVLTEFYAGVADIGPLVENLVRRAEIDGDRTPLTRIARWIAVSDPESPSRSAMIKILARSFMIDPLDPVTRASIGRTIALVAGDGARAFFVQMLRNASPDIRGAALRGLGLCKVNSDLTLLESVLRDEQATAQVRESAAQALLDLGSDEAYAALAGALTEVDPALMLVIAEALAGAPQGEVALEEAAHHPDLFVRRAAAHGLGRISSDWAREKLLEIAREDQEWMVRSAAELALQAQDESDQAPGMITAPPQPDQLDWLIGWAARQGEGLGVGEAAMVMLRRAAQEGNADAKVLSALTLAQIGQESDLAVLGSLTDSTDPLVAQTASWAVHQIRRRQRIFQVA